MTQGGNRFPLYGGLPVFPGMQMGSFDELMAPKTFIPSSKMTADSPLYSQSELDMLLYGYAKSKTSGAGHALSGLSLSDLKQGKLHDIF